MRVPSFQVANQRSIRLAKCEKVPPLMVIAGPNGAGKSTVLNGIRSTAGYTNVMYVGPHRSMRRQHVQQRHLLAPPISFESLLSSQSLPGFEGIRMFDGARDPWNSDDSANYLKHALCQIEVDRQQAIATKFDREGSIPQNAVEDPWKPFRELTHNLLPHLAFNRIDATNRDQVRVIWRVHRLGTDVDLDDLSSGEKSIVQMFYPLVEREIKARVKEIEAGPQAVDRPELCVLIDEPELHLHPNLQMKVLDYLRVLTTGTNTQVILATHSPTIVEYAGFDELYVLRPVELTEEGSNQLVQLADNEERLTFLRDVFGTTTNLTALQPVVVVEGVAEKNAKVLPDRKLYRALHAGFDGVTIIPGGGKSECKALLRVLDAALKDFSSRLQAVALLDRDTEIAAGDEAVHLLPVAMIENFLLDPDSIWEAIQSVLEKTSIKTVDDVALELDKVLAQLSVREIGGRTAANLGSVHFHPTSDLAQLDDSIQAFMRDAGARYSSDRVKAAREAAEEKVRSLEAENRRREEFHGKAVLQEFYRTHLHATGMSKVIFAFETGRHARRRKAVIKYFDDFFAGLFPRQ